MIAEKRNENAEGELASAARSAEEFMRSTSDTVGEKTKELRKRLEAAMESARVATQKLQARAKDAARATDQSIRDHPYEAVGIAFGVGLLLGVLFGRRR